MADNSTAPPGGELPPGSLPLPEFPYPPGTPEFAAWAAEDKGPTSLALTWTFTALAIVFVAARVYTRISVFRSLKSDDYLCLAAVLCAILASAFNNVSINYGNGRHYQFLTIHQATEARRYTLAAFIPSAMSFVFPKFAVVALLTRLLNPSRAHRIVLWSMCVLCFLSLVAAFGILFGQCTPLEAMWDVTLIPQMECIDPEVYVYFSVYVGAISAFVDFYLALYPGFVLWKLQMRLQRKLALTFALGLGCIGGALAVYKTVRLPQGIGNPDFSYETADLINWTIVEGAAIIIAACIPVLSPLMDKVLKHRNPFRSHRKSSGRSSSKGHKHVEGHSSSGHGGYPDMDERAPRRAVLDPFDPDMDLAETIVNPSQEDLPMKKKLSDDVEAQRGHLNTRLSDSSGSTQIASEQAYNDQEGVDSPTGGIMRTNEVDVSSDPRESRDAHLEQLDRNIPWEVPVTSPTSPTAQPMAQTKAWSKFSRQQ